MSPPLAVVADVPEGGVVRMPSLPMREAFAATATELFTDDPRVAIVLAEISGQLFHDARRRDPLEP